MSENDLRELMKDIEGISDNDIKEIMNDIKEIMNELSGYPPMDLKTINYYLNVCLNSIEFIILTYIKPLKHLKETRKVVKKIALSLKNYLRYTGQIGHNEDYLKTAIHRVLYIEIAESRSRIFEWWQLMFLTGLFLQ